MSNPIGNAFILDIAPCSQQQHEQKPHATHSQKGDIDKLETGETAGSRATKQAIDIKQGMSNLNAAYEATFDVSIKDDILRKCLAKDYAGEKEARLEISMISLSMKEKPAYSIDVTPENVDKLIKLINDTSEQGMRLKAELLQGKEELSDEQLMELKNSIQNSFTTGLSSLSQQTSKTR